jgi:FKBP-type peptidyl-prolyl cis-trans isomerase FkpA
MANELNKKEKNFGLTPEAWEGILNQFRAGDTKPLLSTFAKNQEMLKYLIIRKFNCSPDVAEDAVKQGMLDIYDSFKKRIAENKELTKHDKLEYYLTTSCCHAYENRRRKEQRLEVCPINDKHQPIMEESDFLISKSDLRKLSKAMDLANLTPEHKQILDLRFWQKKAWKEVGEAVQKTGDAVKKQWKKTILVKLSKYYHLLLEQFEKDLASIERYAATRQWNLTSLESGLSYLVTKTGGIKKVELNDSIYLKAESRFLNEVILEKGSKTNFKVGASTNITGLNEGLTHFKEDSEGVLLIPSELGYAEHPLNQHQNAILENQVLIYTIHVMNIHPPDNC